MRGKKTWNYGKKYTQDQKIKMNMDGLKLGRMKVSHPIKSNSYGAIHWWVRENKGKAQKCLWCGSKHRIGWANVDHKYRRNLEDYIELCDKCHFKYDTENGYRRSVINPRAIK
jgi:hypothetical protein